MENTCATHLSARLDTCLRLVQAGVFCDVGTDHALLPIALVSSGKCSGGFACDIGEGPLASARNNILDANLSDKIQTVLSDGLDSVPLDGVSTVIIAGMGGETIAKILSRCVPIKNRDVSLVLQPMTKAEAVHSWLFENGFAILDEVFVKDSGHTYIVMKSRFIGFCSTPSESVRYLGRLYSGADSVDDYYLSKLSATTNAKILHNNVTNLTELDLEKLSEGLLDVTNKKEITVREIYEAINKEFDYSLIDKRFDNCGLQVGSPDQAVTAALICLDVTSEVIDEARRIGANLIVSHHPVIFNPLTSLLNDSIAYQLANAGIASISCHTPLDRSPSGIAAVVLNKLQTFCTSTEFEPLDAEFGYGFIVDIESTIGFDELISALKIVFSPALSYNTPPEKVRKIAFVNGSGADYIALAKELGADVFITGDVKHHAFVDAHELGLCVVDCGHYATEMCCKDILYQVLSAEYPSLRLEISTKDDIITHLA